ncbi:MAG: hypothetical protein PVG66_02110 [Chromatiales bacterium]|jgi:hypothetical protein
MTPEQFVKSLQEVCRSAADEDCVEDFQSPPGRKLPEQLEKISELFKRLPEADQLIMVRQAMNEAAEATLFGVLCVLDGVRTIERAGEKTVFRFTAKRGANEQKLSPNSPYLHNLIR